MDIRWSEKKNQRLIKMRGIGFRDLLDLGEIIYVDHNSVRPNQWLMLIWYDRYIWAIPFIHNENGLFLKTLYKSRKHTKKFLKGDYDG